MPCYALMFEVGGSHFAHFKKKTIPDSSFPKSNVSKPQKKIIGYQIFEK